MPTMTQSSNELPLPGVVGLVFDMGDVLIDATAWRRWLLREIAEYGLTPPYRSFFAIWDRDYLDDVHRGTREYGEALRSFLGATGLTDRQIDELLAASVVQKPAMEAETRPFPGVRQTLWRLHGDGVPLAVLSDSESPSIAIRRRLVQLGIGDCFQAVVSSRDLGFTKPDRRAYTAAANELQLMPAQLAFVGHDAEELLGARRAGMRTVAFNFEPNAAAERYLTRFESLLDVVAGRPRHHHFRGAA
jgi:HAD superfamily hydrolase (TIGR01509 family)